MSSEAAFPIGMAEWPRQKAFIQQRIAQHQQELEAATTMERVCHVQGQIASLRFLLGEAEPEYRPGIGHRTA